MELKKINIHNGTRQHRDRFDARCFVHRAATQEYS